MQKDLKNKLFDSGNKLSLNRKSVELQRNSLWTNEDEEVNK